jgi:hypothetical protein
LILAESGGVTSRLAGGSRQAGKLYRPCGGSRFFPEKSFFRQNH